ncbi:unnamed protein product [Bathycoccus prasinos]
MSSAATSGFAAAFSSSPKPTTMSSSVQNRMSESYGKSSSPASFRSSSSVKGASPLPKDVPQTRISGFGVKAQTTTTMKNSSSSSELAKTPPMSTPTRVSPSLSSNSLHSSGMFSPSSAAEEGDFKTHAGFDTTTTTNAASTTTSSTPPKPLTHHLKSPVSPNSKASLFSVVSRNTSQLTTQLSKELGKMIGARTSEEEDAGIESLGLNEENAAILNGLIKEYPKSFESREVQKAFKVCVQAHSDFGHRPLLLDCVGTAKILCELGADAGIISAALLHDVTTTTLLNKDDLLLKGISEEVTKLAMDVGKLTVVSKLHQASGRDLEVEEMRSLRELLLAMTDSRVVIIKLAKRLQTMRTMKENVSRSRRGKLAEETLAVFVPIANRLGMATIKNELEDICFKTLHPEQYEELCAQLKRVSSKETILKAMESFEYAISNDTSMEELKPMEIVGREKGLYSVYKKMKKKNIKLEDVRDVRAIRIIIPDSAGKDGCELVISKVHGLMSKVQGSFKDYVSSPKSNGYQSLHTVVKDEAGNNLEVQVRTVSMHMQAEFGVAAHWRYKVNDTCLSSPVDESGIRWARFVLSRMQDVKDKSKVRLPGKPSMENTFPFPSSASSSDNESMVPLDVSGSFDEFTVLEDAMKRANVNDALSSSPNAGSPSAPKMTYVILVIDGSMSIKEVEAGSRLSEVDLLDDQKTMPAVRNGFSSEFVGIRTLRVNRENVDIDDVHNFEMKLGDVIEVTRSRISRYDFEENESVVSAEAAASAANGSNSKATYFPDLEVHAMPVA